MVKLKKGSEKIQAKTCELLDSAAGIIIAHLRPVYKGASGVVAGLVRGMSWACCFKLEDSLSFGSFRKHTQLLKVSPHWLITAHRTQACESAASTLVRIWFVTGTNSIKPWHPLFWFVTK